MTQSQFMYDLMVELEGIPDEDKFVVMNDYTQYFSDSIENGLSEDDIINALRSPKEIADGYKNGTPIPIKGVESVLGNNRKGNKTVQSVFKFILLIPVCALYEVLTVLLGLACLAVTLVLCAVGALASVTAFLSVPLNNGFIFLGFGGIFLTFSCVMLCAVVFKGAVGAVLKFPVFMGKVLNNRKKEGNKI